VTQTALINARVFTPAGLRDDQVVVIENGLIKAVTDQAPNDATIHDLAGQTLLPGFIDLQVNGGGGYLFNDAPTSDTIARIARAHRRFGTTGLLPTLISDDLDVVRQGILAIDEAIAAGVPGILGIHIEGPFLAESRKGIHLAEKLRMLKDSHLELLCSARFGKTLVTLAPECATPDQINRLSQAGVLISLGHSNASYATARAALDAGATGFTHLFNAMSQLVNREPGMVGAALESRTAFAGIIVDGLHVDPVNLKIALRARGGHDRFMLISDAMPNIGTDMTAFQLQHQHIHVTPDACRNEDGILAGANLTMLNAVRLAHRLLDLPLEHAVAMGSLNPARFLGLDSRHGAITPGKYADLLAINDLFQVTRTYIKGI